MSRAEGPQPIGAVLCRLLARRQLSQVTARMELERSWREAAGEQLYRRTQLGRLRRGVLEILVDNAALLQELEGFRKSELLERLQQLQPGLRLTRLAFCRA